MERPFLNEYTVRRVAQSDSKSCFICYKPTTCVLLSSNKADFFYACESHLKDSSFSSPNHPQSYNSALTEKITLTKEIELMKKQIDANTYSWNGLMKKVGWNKEDAEKEAKLAKDNDKLKELESSLVKQQDILNIPTKQYTLNQDIYKIRLTTYFSAKRNKERLDKLQNPGFFPSIPTSLPGSTPSVNDGPGDINPT